MLNDTGVSFIVTVFNQEPYLERTLESLLAQEGDFKREIIVINDGSTDGSLDIAKRILGPHPNSRIISQSNSGPAVGFNVAARAAKYPFLKFVDGDDALTADSILRLLPHMSDERVALVIAMGSVYTKHHKANFGNSAAKVLDEPLEFVARYSLSASTEAMVRRDAYLSVGGCDESLFIQGETYIHRLALKHAIVLTEDEVRINLRTEIEGLNDNKLQIEHDRNAAFFNLLREHPEIPPQIKRLIFRRAVKRAWRWSRNVNNAGSVKELNYWLGLLSFFPWFPDYTRFKAVACAPYHKSGTVRRGG